MTALLLKGPQSCPRQRLRQVSYAGGHSISRMRYLVAFCSFHKAFSSGESYLILLRWFVRKIKYLRMGVQLIHVVLGSDPGVSASLLLLDSHSCPAYVYV